MEDNEIAVVLKEHIDKTHIDLAKTIYDIQQDIVEHGTRMNTMEREINMFKEHLSRIESKQEDLNKSVNNFMLEIPTTFEKHTSNTVTTVVTQMSTLLDQKFENCRQIQDTKNEKSFLKLPPGFWGNLIRVVIFLVCFGGGFITLDMFFK